MKYNIVINVPVGTIKKKQCYNFIAPLSVVISSLQKLSAFIYLRIHFYEKEDIPESFI